MVPPPPPAAPAPNSGGGEPPLAPPLVGLTDLQRRSLARLWTTHSFHLDGPHCEGDPALGTTGSDLDDRTYRFIARLYSFLAKCVEAHSAAGIGRREEGRLGRDAGAAKPTAGLVVVANGSSISDARRAGDWDEGVILGRRTFGSLRHLLRMRQNRIHPRVMAEGRQVVQLDHVLFEEELARYELPQLPEGSKPPQEYVQQHSYGSFLYHLPERALAAMGCAVGLMLSELIRKSLNQGGQQGQQQHQEEDRQQEHENIRRILDFTRYCVRFTNVYPLVRMIDIKTNLAFRFITVKGHVTKARPKRLRIVTADFQCPKCGEAFPHRFRDGRYVPPDRCPTPKCRSRNFTLCRSTARYIDVQQIRLQETQDESTIDAGRTPRQIDVEVTHELVDSCNTGDVVHVAGIVRAVNSAVAAGRGGKRAQETATYKLYITANTIVNTSNNGAGGDEDGVSSMSFSSDQLSRIVQLAHADHMYGPMSSRMAFPFDLLVRSICPSIIGHDIVKAGILLGLMGGTPPVTSGVQNISAGMTIRSNIHVLIVGDPGMGKSQMLLAAAQVVARSVYVGGNTASTTGLTVSMTKESSGEVGIEAGALVLADQGVCLIDEFDKMERNHQDGLLEAMEQQQVSIAKAGVVASLPARCSVIAAANPKHGSYNLGKTVAENLSMASPLLSRFDLVFILLDQADTDQDQRISSNIMSLYRQQGGAGASNSVARDNSSDSGTDAAKKFEQYSEEDRVPMMTRLPWVAETQKQPLPADLVKDYIAYAREYCHPKMTGAAAEVLKRYFMELRYPNNHNKDSVPITTRQLEALIRLSQARAKACLRDFVLKEDAEDVVELLRESVRQVHVTDAAGHIDKSRGGAGGTSNRKAKKAFEAELRKVASMKRDDRLYMGDVFSASKAANLGYDVNSKDLIEHLRDMGVVMQKMDRNGEKYFKFC
jgi:DNA helicase MCM8